MLRVQEFATKRG